ncbi:MAG: hypothetical protein QG600_661 [Patescibacteria group bacterium]|nr:hypothetical protein [Patescibacteria group bacterium]
MIESTTHNIFGSTCPFREHASPRNINNAPKIRDIKQNGVLSLPDNHNTEDGLDISAYKEDLFALSAILIPEIINLSLQNIPRRKPDGLLRPVYYGKHSATIYSESVAEPITGSTPFDYLRNALKQTLHTDLNTLVRGYTHCQRPNEGNDLSEIYRKLNENVQREEGVSAQAVLARGLNTATHVMNDTLNVIEVVSQREGKDYAGNTEGLVKVARINYETIKQLSGLHIRYFTKLNSALCNSDTNYSTNMYSEQSFNPDYFTLTDDGSLQLTDEFIQQFGENNQDFFDNPNAPKTPTIRCPGAYGTGIFNLWNWNIELAQKIWEQKYE